MNKKHEIEKKLAARLALDEYSSSSPEAGIFLDKILGDIWKFEDELAKFDEPARA